MIRKSASSSRRPTITAFDTFWLCTYGYLYFSQSLFSPHLQNLALTLCPSSGNGRKRFGRSDKSVPMTNGIGWYFLPSWTRATRSVSDSSLRAVAKTPSSSLRPARDFVVCNFLNGRTVGVHRFGYHRRFNK